MGENKYNVLLNLINMTRYQAGIEVNAYMLEECLVYNLKWYFSSKQRSITSDSS